MKIELKENGQPSKEEILQMGQGQKQVILAGEEPLNRVGIVDIVKKLQAEEIYIETDGQKLESMAEKLKKAGLAGVIIKVNTMRYTRYKSSNDGKDLANVVDGINSAVGHQLKVRLQVSLEKGFSDDEVLDFVQLTFQHDYEIVFMPTMPYEDIKAKMRLHPASGEYGEIEMFKYAGARGKLGFFKTIKRKEADARRQ